MEDLSKLRKQCVDSLYECTDDVLKYLDDEKDEQLTVIKNCLRDYCLMEAMQNFEDQALETVKREIDASNLNSLEEKFNAHLNRMVAQQRSNVDNHYFMQQFEKRVRSDLPTVSQNLDESDIAITEAQETCLDPITKKPIEEPVRNTLCGHVYERTAIHQYISNRSRAKCPVVGCGNSEPIQMDHLLEDDEMRFRLSAQQAASRRY